MNPVDTVLEFLNRINSGDAEQVAGMLTEDHLFVDGLGRAVHGRENVRAAWRGYFGMCPDYRVSHHTILANNNRVAMFGEAGGTIVCGDGQLLVENRWSRPAAWLAAVEEGLIQEWRVYADNKPVYEILAKISTGTAAGER
jgi:ketosteroid isomerase-like protein